MADGGACSKNQQNKFANYMFKYVNTYLNVYLGFAGPNGAA